MKTAFMSSVLALMIAPAAFADQVAITDFNQDGVINDADLVGSNYSSDDTVSYGVAPETGSYVSIGEYQGGAVGTNDIIVAPAVTATEIYTVPLGETDTNASVGFFNDSIYQPPTVTGDVFTAAGTGFVDDEYENARLAAYDANNDGTITSSEAIAGLAPLIAPNINASRGDLRVINEGVTLERP